MNHRYGLNQAGFPASEIETTCEILADAGYDGVEPNYREGGLLTTADGRERVREAADGNGLTVPAVSTTLHWEYPLSSADDEKRGRGIDIACEMVDAAATLGADEVLIVPARIFPGAGYDADYRRAVESVRGIAGYAADAGVGVAVENVQNDFLYSPREFVEFLEAVEDSGPVSAYFDVGNGFRWGLPDRWIRGLGDWISKVHVKDWLTDAHRPTYLLQGDIDWDSVVAALSDVGYDGWISAEIPPYNSAPHRMPPDELDTMRYLFEPSD
ncbi:MULTISPECIES: sugar phosphate isomerase/epimerase family protein [unclassified Haladaptatus]|uniref:sugar phosphate isomerase/epimerase family protein n=1 Tax=unclassified Haladaptatus TaxID=2622732 RepID=UPI00209C0521|nr:MULTISPECIES: sugar phosphate isomerase/epimerase family protein [unclassified Haladaptatus]MCO8245527.1 sugar phosphate isomerase/epimerase [Haladaptatus sp. AB643]MCO8255353.1 sugar phosphate isomerase/epimerase [Haladaptatus sp. AB618]